MLTYNDRLRRLTQLSIATPIEIDWLTRNHREGERFSPYVGATGTQVIEYRDYEEGDRPNRVNWTLTARQTNGRILVNLMEEQRDVNVCILVDLSSEMDMASTGLSKRELACVTTASIIRSAGSLNDPTMFAGYDAGGMRRYFGSCHPGMMLLRAPSAVLDGSPDDYIETGSGLACALSRLPKKRSLVFILSDLLNFGAEDEKALDFFGWKHEVIVLHISDERERVLPATRMVPFLGIPGFFPVADGQGRVSSVWTTKANREAHARRFQAHEDALFTRLDRLGCKYASLHTEANDIDRRETIVRILSGSRKHSNNLNPVKGEQS